MAEALIIDGVRTPRGKGKPGGGLSGIHPQELLAQTLNRLVGRVDLDPAEIDDVITGCALAQGDHDHCIARLSVLAAGWPTTVPGVTLNRFCGSGQQAINFAAMQVSSGQGDVVMASGVEMMSHYPPGGSLTLDGGNPALRARHPVVPQGISGDLIATLEGFTREDVDRFALLSQQRAAIAVAEDRFARSTFAVTNVDGTVLLDREQLPRETSLQALGALAPSFAGLGSALLEGYDKPFDEMCRDRYSEVDAVQHVHHAGNSSGIADGASAVLVANRAAAQRHGWKPRARIVATAVAGAEPVVMLTAPGPATELCLRRAGMTVDDVDLFEVNEAFASVPLKFLRDLKVDPEKMNVNGGAIALGHPIGATGPMLMLTLLDELERRGLQTGVVAMCTGGGMATATLIERM